MKKIIIFLIFVLLFSQHLIAQKKHKTYLQDHQVIQKIQKLIQSQKMMEAVHELYQLKKSKHLDQAQISYFLGLALMEQGYHQLAAMQFIDTIRRKNKKYLSLSLDKLFVVADYLGDDSMIYYVVSKIDQSSPPQNALDAFYLRHGEYLLDQGQSDKAIQVLKKISHKSPFYFLSQYKTIIGYLELNQIEEAIKLGKLLLKKSTNSNDNQLVTLLLARSFFQGRNWDKAIEYYQKIPRDSLYWPQALFELSWAQLRGARFRSVIGTMQTLHSPFFENEYHPETFVVRSIVYLYICRFDEAQKTIEVFNKVYGRYIEQTKKFYNQNQDNRTFWEEVRKAALRLENKDKNINFLIPYPIIKKFVTSGEAQKLLKYINKLNRELKKWESDLKIKDKPIYHYGKKVINRRIQAAQNQIVRLGKFYLRKKIEEWNELQEQVQFITYEIVSGQKEQLKNRLNDQLEELDEDKKREFYVNNGYEYWPVDREIWLDELGNFHYMGIQQCR